MNQRPASNLPPAKTLLTVAIALVWLIFGLFGKVLNFAPHHQAIVARILGVQYAMPITKAIGLMEILMAAWVASRIQSRWCAVFQMTLVAAMNVLEFLLAPDLLMFGKMNILFALVFIAVVFLNEFILGKPAAVLQPSP